MAERGAQAHSLAFSGAVDGLGAVAPLLRRLARFADLAPVEIEQVRNLGASRKRWRPGATLLADGRVTSAHFVLSGWACSQRVLRDGRRQIFDFILPGEGFGFGPLAEAQGRQTVVALTSVETVDASAMLEGVHDTALGGLWRAIRAMIQEEDARRLDHMVRLGQLTAYEKTAHFILEMQRRSGAGEAHRFPLPLTQETIGDALGVSVVHLNRVLRRLRDEGVAEVRGGVARVHDHEALAVAAILTLGGEAPAPPR
jgi:CRP-like cAMP-binding protein